MFRKIITFFSIVIFAIITPQPVFCADLNEKENIKHYSLQILHGYSPQVIPDLTHPLSTNDTDLIALRKKYTNTTLRIPPYLREKYENNFLMNIYPLLPEPRESFEEWKKERNVDFSRDVLTPIAAFYINNGEYFIRYAKTSPILTKEEKTHYFFFYHILYNNYFPQGYPITIGDSFSELYPAGTTKSLTLVPDYIPQTKTVIKVNILPH